MMASWVILDVDNSRDLTLGERLKKYAEILKNEEDESLRWDAVWLTGEVAQITGPGNLFDRASDLLAWVLQNDDNGVVKHEACYQISSCNMRNKIPDLLKTGLYNKSSLARHEAIECLGFMEAFEIRNDLKKALNDPVDYVRETAIFAMKRLDRMQYKKDQFKQSKIL